MTGMDARRRLSVIVAVAAAVVPGPALGDVYLRAQGGWLDVHGGAEHGVGFAYLGGPGFSGEFGFDLFDRFSLSGELMPSYDQPARNIAQNSDVDGGSYSATMGNIRVRLEPIERVQPYLLVGGGQSIFHFDYADSGKPFFVNGVPRRFTEETQKAWTLALGFGFDSPLSSWLLWGVRGRYLAHRWRSVTDKDRAINLPSGHAWAIDAGLTLRF